jgi:hypothetical protein
LRPYHSAVLVDVGQLHWVPVVVLLTLRVPYPLGGVRHFAMSGDSRGTWLLVNRSKPVEVECLSKPVKLNVAQKQLRDITPTILDPRPQRLTFIQTVCPAGRGLATSDKSRYL